ncbi:hypothetical protein H4O18_06950 [Arenibacter sp. BSSL-BM3]|uniref:Uncharacterized protein n=1 Tax=Arenibacter arenosicollis TaxID=2762274 RepID=A0ABR7QKL6_9FLAO|nr:hypothetical protein [Arenibacter arenosicollis]MBC8767725.1 hypothetical protein [Arenibacter arenosicollis]
MAHEISKSEQNIISKEYRKYNENQKPSKETTIVKESTSQVECPGSEEKDILNKISELAKEHFHTIKRYPSKKELYTVNLITDGYLETSFMISSLLKVCITALEAEHTSNNVVPEPEQNIREVLGYVLNMIPYEEMEFLDKIRHILPGSEPK